jgi:PIN domain
MTSATTTSFFVLLDANVWVSERLLTTTVGSALIYAVSASGATIVVPEIVELEVSCVLHEHAEQAVENIRKATALLKQLTQNPQMSLIVPNRSGIEKAMRARWEDLQGAIRRIEFSHDHAKRALNRILAKRPPSGQNNEQFRDCCIWEAALDFAKEGPVHLITNDSAFYENRDRNKGLPILLREELECCNSTVTVYQSISHFLAEVKETVSEVDQALVSEKITASIGPSVNYIMERINRRNDNFALGKMLGLRIKGFATPKPYIVAVSFTIGFDLVNLSDRIKDATLTVEGTCSYDAQGNDALSEVDIISWTASLKRSGDGWQSESWQKPEMLERAFSDQRLIQ